jgi:hypothetical protein
MKLKMIAVAFASLSAGLAFGATKAVLCDTTTLSNLVNTCAPEVTFYVGGAGSQTSALTSVLEAGGIFDNSKLRGKLTDTAVSLSGGGNTIAYVGFGATTNSSIAGKRLVVLFNKVNGSGAAVNQLMTGKGGNGEEVTMYTATVKDLAKGILGTCTVIEPATTGALGTGTCTTETAFSTAWGIDKQKKLHLALSSVRPNELIPGVVKGWTAAKYPSVTTGSQIYGIMVNPKLYMAMVNAQVAAGTLPASCATSEVVGGGTGTTDTISAACQPSISQPTFTGLVRGEVTTANKLLGTTGDANKVVLARGVDSAGNVAATAIHFLGYAGYNAKTMPKDNAYHDMVAAGTTIGDLSVASGNNLGAVISLVAGNTTDYAIGVMSGEQAYSKTVSSSKLLGALWVKLNGLSPNFDPATGALDTKQRTALLNGYPFAYEIQAVTSAALADPYLSIANSIIAGLTDPARNLVGIAYIDSTDATKNTSYRRIGNNFLPLSKY